MYLFDAAVVDTDIQKVAQMEPWVNVNNLHFYLKFTVIWCEVKRTSQDYYLNQENEKSVIEQLISEYRSSRFLGKCSADLYEWIQINTNH